MLLLIEEESCFGQSALLGSLSTTGLILKQPEKHLRNWQMGLVRRGLLKPFEFSFDMIKTWRKPLLWPFERKRKMTHTVHTKHFFTRALTQQVNSGEYTVVIDRGEKTCLQVHQEICEALHAGGVSHSWTPLLQNVKCIVGFGGLSEAGKSTVATETIANFGAQAVRLKIVYLMQSAARESGTNLSDLPDERQAVHLIQQLDLFAHAHYWLKIISIESLHGFTMTSQLQHLIAGKVMIVYLDTEEKKRFERVDIQLREFLEKDKVKKARGAHRIKEIADVVVDNNGTFQDTVDRVTLAVRAYLT